MDKFEELEINILRNAVDKANLKQKRKLNNKSTKDIVKIVEEFIIKKKLLCYGGSAINNLLPKNVQFYDYNLEIPDYDFFSKNALQDAKELADIYFKKGYTETEAKAGVHFGTYKVFVNFIPIADITMMEPEIYDNLKKDKITINKISYVPPNFLRMSAYLELSRPDGDTSRWEKILKRVNLLNKYHPIVKSTCKVNKIKDKNTSNTSNVSNKILNSIKNICIKSNVVFFGPFAFKFYSNYLSTNEKRIFNNYIENNNILHILSTNPEDIILKLKKILPPQTKYNKFETIGEIIPKHYSITIDDNPVLFIFEPLACHSYNNIKYKNTSIKIATIDTIISLFLSFIYSSNISFIKNDILCMIEFLFKIQIRNKFKQVGVLKRFSIHCYGKQNTIEDIRANKTKKYKEIKKKLKKINISRKEKNKMLKEKEYYFLRYIPSDNQSSS